MTIALQGVAQRGIQNQPPAAPAPVNVPVANAPHRVNSDLVYRDAGAYTDEIMGAVDRLVNERLAGASQNFASPMSSMARDMAKSHKPEIWRAYEPEIDALMADVPAQAKLNVDLWKRAVNMVASDHIEEISRARAEEIMRSGNDTGGLRSGGGAPLGNVPSAASSPIRAMFASNDPAILPFKDAGLDAAAVIAHYAKMGKDETRAADTIKNAASRRVRAIA